MPEGHAAVFIEAEQQDCEIAAAIGVMLIFGQQISYVLKGDKPRFVLLEIQERASRCGPRFANALFAAQAVLGCLCVEAADAVALETDGRHVGAWDLYLAIHTNKPNR